MQYIVRRAQVKPQLIGDFNGDPWMDADVAKIDKFHDKSSDHRPITRAKMLHDDDGVFLTFRVRDRYVICRNTEHQSPVFNDSCVEAFLQPREGGGYFNFELNCGGAMLLYYVTDATRARGALTAFERVEPSLMESIRIYHSMPETVEPEMPGPVEWTVEYFVPNAVFERYSGPLGEAKERAWRGNFYKCADASSHPHWASWSPIGEELNFHSPQHFAPFRFE